jgi:predicted  nucleic acid-binding Zn-ribbon protein
MATSIAATKTQVSTTVADLQALKTATDVKAAYAKVNQNTEGVKSHAAKVKSDYDAMKAQTDVFVETWQKEIASVQDPALKATAAKRFADVKIAFLEITNTLGAAKEAYQPFITSLEDIHKVLGNDVTPGGVKSVTPAIDKAIANSKALDTKLGEANTQIATLRGELGAAVEKKEEAKKQEGEKKEEKAPAAK